MKVLFADDAVFYVTAGTLSLCIERIPILNVNKYIGASGKVSDVYVNRTSLAFNV